MNTLTLELIATHFKPNFFGRECLTEFYSVTGEEKLIDKFVKDIPYSIIDGKTVVWTYGKNKRKPVKGVKLVDDRWIRVY